MGRRGPKRKSDPVDAGKSSKGATLGARVRESTRERLVKSASANDRSLSEELETRLLLSFDLEERWGTYEAHALLKLMNLTIERIEGVTGERWHADRFTYDLASAALQLLLKTLPWRPQGDGAPPASFPNFIGWEPSFFRRAIEHDIAVNRSGFLENFASQVTTDVIKRVQEAPGTTAPEGDVYRRIATGLSLLKENSK